MTEPIYNFKKGVGWVAGPVHEIVTYEQDGYRVTLENREPRPGELWWADLPGYPFSNSAANVKVMIGRHFATYAKRRGGVFEPGNYKNHTFIVCTVVKL
jgi:hypothetical protein